MAVTFSSVSLVKPRITDYDYDIVCNPTDLLSGAVSIQADTRNNLFPIAFRCVTQTFADITDLAALAGTAYTLTIGTTAYTNCYLASLRVRPNEDHTIFEYFPTFRRDTSL